MGIYRVPIRAKGGNGSDGEGRKESERAEERESEGRSSLLSPAHVLEDLASPFHEVVDDRGMNEIVEIESKVGGCGRPMGSGKGMEG